MRKCDVCWIAALCGFVVAFFGFAVLLHGWPWATGEETNAPAITDWLTSIGTIGAVAISLGSLARIQKHQRQERLTTLKGTAWIIDSAISNLEFSTRQICDERLSHDQYNPDVLSGCRSSVNQALSIPYHQPPFSDCLRDLNITLDKLRSGLATLDRAIAGDAVSSAKFQAEVKMAREAFNNALSAPVFHGVPRPITAYWEWGALSD